MLRRRPRPFWTAPLPIRIRSVVVRAPPHGLHGPRGQSQSDIELCTRLHLQFLDYSCVLHRTENRKGIRIRCPVSAHWRVLRARPPNLHVAHLRTARPTSATVHHECPRPRRTEIDSILGRYEASSHRYERQSKRDMPRHGGPFKLPSQGVAVGGHNRGSAS